MSDPSPADKPNDSSPITPSLSSRDGIRRALMILDGKEYLWGTDMMEPDEYGKEADLIIQQMSGSPAATRLSAVHSCDNCEGVDPGSCAMSRQRLDAHAEGEHAFCGDECDAPDDEPPAYEWAQSVHSTDGTRTVHIPWLGPDGREAGSIRVHHTDVRTLALMLCDDTTRITDPSTEPETDEERADRLEIESEHAAGIHTHCGVTCEEEFPSIMLRNTILVRAIPGSATMLDELIRRAEAKAKNCKNCDHSKAVDMVAKYVEGQQ